MPDDKPIPREDINTIQRWERVGNENRMSLKAKSQQRKSNALFREHYEQIFGPKESV